MQIDDPDKEMVLKAQQELPYATQSYELLVRKYNQPVTNFCYGYLKNEEASQSAAQETWLKVFHKIKLFEFKSTFKYWVFRIARNYCLNKIKYEKTHKLDRDGYKVFNEDLVGADKSAEEIDISILKETIKSMKENDREILGLRFFSGLKISEIADVLNISDSSCKMRLYRALDNLKVKFKKRKGVSNE